MLSPIWRSWYFYTLVRSRSNLYHVAMIASFCRLGLFGLRRYGSNQPVASSKDYGMTMLKFPILVILVLQMTKSFPTQRMKASRPSRFVSISGILLPSFFSEFRVLKPDKTDLGIHGMPGMFESAVFTSCSGAAVSIESELASQRRRRQRSPVMACANLQI